MRIGGIGVGGNTAARTQIGALAACLDFDPVGAGGLASARLIEPFEMLWIRSAHRCGLGSEVASFPVRRQTAPR